MAKDFSELTAQVHHLVRQGKYQISYHALNDHPERNITAADIIEVLKIGSIADLELRIVAGREKYEGAQRYRWFGEDERDRVLRLILVVKDNVIVISAVEATNRQSARYQQEDR